MSGLSFSMTQQVTLANVLGTALAEIELKATQAEEYSMTSQLFYQKGKYVDLFGACEKIAQSLMLSSDHKADCFMRDVTHARQIREAHLKGDPINV